MKTLEVLTKCFNWQGGTIHQALAEVKRCGKISGAMSAYRLGLNDGINYLREENPPTIANVNIPINSFEEQYGQQSIDYILGLINSGL